MEDAIVLEMRRRVRRHMLTSFFGAIGMLAVAALGAGAIRAIGGDAAWVPQATGIAGIVAILFIPVIGWTSTFFNLRCPSCNGFVAWQVSAKYSAFGAMASNQCRHCGVTIFAPSATRRFFFVIAMIAIGFGIAAAVMGAMLSRGQMHHDPAPASAAP
ncbi:MAG: hypothetical protein U0234_27810 [Sandaracinus sp.]